MHMGIESTQYFLRNTKFVYFLSHFAIFAKFSMKKVYSAAWQITQLVSVDVIYFASSLNMKKALIFM